MVLPSNEDLADDVKFAEEDCNGVGGEALADAVDISDETVLLVCRHIKSVFEDANVDVQAVTLNQRYDCLVARHDGLVRINIADTVSKTDYLDKLYSRRAWAEKRFLAAVTELTSKPSSASDNAPQGGCPDAESFSNPQPKKLPELVDGIVSRWLRNEISDAPGNDNKPGKVELVRGQVAATKVASKRVIESVWKETTRVVESDIDLGNGVTIHIDSRVEGEHIAYLRFGTTTLEYDAQELVEARQAAFAMAGMLRRWRF